MANEDDFFVRLGKPGRDQSFSKRVRAVVAKEVRNRGAKSPESGRRKSQFTGERIGRGHAVAAVMSSRSDPARYQRRVIIKSRIVKLAGKGLESAKAHLRYIQRDGTNREGERGDLYDRENDLADGRDFLKKQGKDRHQFRFIISPEDGHQYEDLKPLVRNLMRQMEQDLGTKLDWVAVDHFNTGYPHAHVILRGVDDKKKDLIIARNYMTEGMRERAAECVTRDLGPRLEHEIENSLRREMEQERFTSIDNALLKGVDEHGLVSSASQQDPFYQTLHQGRLQMLKRLGLAREVRKGWWELDKDMEKSLRTMSERGDILKTMHRQMEEHGLFRTSDDTLIFDPNLENQKPVVGRLVTRGLHDEMEDRHYLIVDGVDGRLRYIDIGDGDALEPLGQGAIVEITAKPAGPRKSDLTIMEIATANGGLYSAEIHMNHDPRATHAYAETHLRRLEAIRKATQAVERTTDICPPSAEHGTWNIPPDYLDRVREYEQMKKAKAPVNVRVLSPHSFDIQATYDGPTWLDVNMTDGSPDTARNCGFGKDLNNALKHRRNWLVEQGLGEFRDGTFYLQNNMLKVLRKREMDRLGRELSKELGKHPYTPIVGECIEGTVTRTIMTGSGKMAVVEKSREFTLVPWRPVLERSIGKQISGHMRGGPAGGGREIGDIDWTIGRQRGLDIGM